MRSESENRAAILAEARSWIGTPYHPCSRLKGVGVDCAQILIGVYSAVGLVEPFETGHYPRDWMLHRDEERYLEWVQKYAHQVDAPRPGDIAMFKFGRCVSHGAIVTDWPTLIHAYSREGNVCYGDGTRGELGPRLHSFYSVFE